MKSSTIARVVVVFALCAGSAIAMAETVKKPHFPVPKHHIAYKTLSPEKNPKSTLKVALPTARAGAGAAEVQRLESNSVNQLHAEARSEARPAVRAVRVSGTEHAHGTPINFTYHAPRAH